MRTVDTMSTLFSRKSWQNLARDKSDTLLLIVSCLLVILPHSDHLPWWITALTCAILLWRAQVTFAGQRMPSRYVLLPVAGLCIFAVYASQRSLFGREAGVCMLVLLLALKMLEMHARRDLFVVTYLALFLILTNFLYSQSIATACMMALALVAIITTQLSFQYTGKVPPLKTRILHSARLLAMALPLTIILFFLFPRIQGPLWGMPGDATARSGLNDKMSPGSVSNLALSQELAFSVKFYDPPPPPAKRYWRGPVLGEFDGRTWVEVSWRDYPVLIAPPVSISARSTPVRYQVTQEASGRRWLYALETARSIPMIDDQPALITRDLQLVSRRSINKRIRFDIGSVTDAEIEAKADPRAIQRFLRLPPGFNPRSLALARELMEQESSAQGRINLILKRFRQQNFSYTLEPPLLGQHSVDEFLFVTRAGFCEHYASSFVFMMRAMQIPARVVTGYQGGEINPVDGIMQVRQSDAHAWAEVWLEGQGWIRVDPTAAVAPERVEQNLARALPASQGIVANLPGISGLLNNNPFLTSMRNQLQAINTAWNQWVLDYTPERQRSFLNSLGLDGDNWRSMVMLALLLGSITMAVILWPMIRQTRDPINVIYFALSRSMAKRGLARLPHEGPQAWSRRLELALPADAAALAAQFLQLYSRQLFARPEQQLLPKELLATLKSLLKRLNRTLS